MNMSGKNSISAAELKRVVESLKEQRDIIKKGYYSSIRGDLIESAACLKVSGLDYKKIIYAFDDNFYSILQKFEDLIYALENDIIKNYSELTEALRQLFGAQFANKLSSLLGLNK